MGAYGGPLLRMGASLENACGSYACGSCPWCWTCPKGLARAARADDRGEVLEGADDTTGEC